MLNKSECFEKYLSCAKLETAVYKQNQPNNMALTQTTGHFKVMNMMLLAFKTKKKQNIVDIHKGEPQSISKESNVKALSMQSGKLN